MPLASARDHAAQPPDDPSPGEAAGGAVLSVVVVGHDPAERARLTALLAATPGVSASGAEPRAGSGATHPRPDVVLLVQDALATDALRTLREVRASWPAAPVLVLSASDAAAANRALVRSGARGVVPGSRASDHLLAAIRKVSEGEIWLSRGCLSRLIDEMAAASRATAHPLPSGQAFAMLTEREHDVVGLIAEGLHNRAIAAQLGITENTVRHHLTAIYGKLGVADRLELAVCALRHRRVGRGSKPPGAAAP